MREAVWAEYHHLISTNYVPLHGLCPTGPETRCKFKKAEAEGELYDHSEHFLIPTPIIEEIRPIFQDLSHTDILRRCLHGGTQNANESLNSIIWSRVPKSTFVMKQSFEFGVNEAVACYNIGNIAKCQILKKLGFSPGKNCIEVMRKADELRIKKAEKTINELEKKYMKQATLAKTQLEDQFKEGVNEDEPAYGAGLY